MSDLWRGRLPGRRQQRVDPAQKQQFVAELRSRHSGIAFRASIQFWWRVDDNTNYWSTRQNITEWADEVSARYFVTQAGNAENEINTQNPVGALVQLTVDPQARAAAEAILELGWKAELERLRHQAELEQVGRLRESVYSRPDVARGYWLYHHPDQLNAMLEIKFEEIAEKFANSEESRSLVIARLLDVFLTQIEDVDRRHLIGQLGQVFKSYDRADLADQLHDTR